jgi:hypothetical protein
MVSRNAGFSAALVVQMEVYCWLPWPLLKLKEPKIHGREGGGSRHAIDQTSVKLNQVATLRDGMTST